MEEQDEAAGQCGHSAKDKNAVIRFFSTAAEWRGWLEANHATEQELLVGFHKRGSGMASMTWPESVDEALCFGWIDGVRRSIDGTSYSIRFTPRRARSLWSNVNIRRVEDLRTLGQITEAGLKAFEKRTGERSGVYAFEQGAVAFTPAQEARFRDDDHAWSFFSAQPNWYRRTATWWVISAKQEGTRERRLGTLIADSKAGRTIRELTRTKKS